MKSESPPYSVAIINYRSYADLGDCLESLKRQTVGPEVVVVIDHDSDFLLLEALQRQYAEVIWQPSANRGYAGGANAGLALCAEKAPHSEFFLLLNPDIVLEPTFAGQLLAAMDEEPEVALASGKLLRGDEQLIDSAGIEMGPMRRPRDRGSETADRGQFERRELVFGASGAAMLIRRAALPSLSISGEVFDEDFFAYHEDTDLSWRAQRLGWKVLYEPSAVGIHGRRWQKGDRFAISTEVRRHSFKNHYLEMAKNETLMSFLRSSPAILLGELLRLGFALAFDRHMLQAYREAWRLLPSALAKRKIILARARECGGRPYRVS